MTVIVLYNQSLQDLAIQVYGTVAATLFLALANQISVTEDLVPGTILNTPNYDGKLPEIVNKLSDKNIKPATIIRTSDLIIEIPQGIGAMEIDKTFIVN